MKRVAPRALFSRGGLSTRDKLAYNGSVLPLIGTTSSTLFQSSLPLEWESRTWASAFSRRGISSRRTRRSGSESGDGDDKPDDNQEETSQGPTEITPYVKPQTGLAVEDEAISNVQIQSTERGNGVFPYKVMGHETQSVEINLKPGDGIRAEIGSLIYMTDGVEMETQAGGLSKGLTRYMTGESFFVTDFNYNGTTEGKLAFGSNFPSKIVPLKLKDHGSELICQKGAFLAGAKDTEIEMFFTKTLTAGFFGGEGFILQKLVGDGLVLIKGGGSLIKKTLAPGETLTISSGCLVAFESNVQFDVKMVTGAKNIIFGGQGLFMSTLTGPGNVWIQSLPFDRLVDAIAYRIPQGGYNPGLLAAMGMHGLMGGASGGAGDAAGGAAGGAGDAAGAAAGGAAAGAAGDFTGAKMSDVKDDIPSAAHSPQPNPTGFDDVGNPTPSDVPAGEELPEEEVADIDEGEVMGDEPEGDWGGDDDDDDEGGGGVGGFFSSLFGSDD